MHTRIKIMLFIIDYVICVLCDTQYFKRRWKH